MRPPIVAIVGHIDHGKSTLLDYIRHTTVVAGEAGGITQHLSAYEATHKTPQGERKITFLDTPGHEAFKAMRLRGLEVADVAVLVVSAEDGVKPQTIEALKLIQEVNIPYIVALTKVDKPGANVEKAKMSLLEHGIFLEGLGGEVPAVAVSGKTGEGVPELLDLILLAGELEGLTEDPDAPAGGVVIEAHVDPRRGNTATLILETGAIKTGEFVVAGPSFAPVRIMENFLGKPIKSASAGSPVQIVGFTILPTVGEKWKTVETKKEAEVDAAEALTKLKTKVRTSDVTGTSDVLDQTTEATTEQIKVVVPLVIKTDVAGTGEAVVHELQKLPQDGRLEVRIVSQSVGTITENDVKLVAGSLTPGIVVGFNVKIEAQAKDLAERQGVELAAFDIIYKLAEWLGDELKKRIPRMNQENSTGAAKVLKVFSTQKNRVVLGGKVEEGSLSLGEVVKIVRRDEEVGRGEIVSLQAQKKDVKKVEAGSEFGAMIKTSIEPAGGDRLEAFEVVVV